MIAALAWSYFVLVWLLEPHEQRIADLERELRLKDERINKLKDEVDSARDLIRRLEEHVQERNEEMENFIMIFGLEMNDEGKWTNSKALKEQREFFDKYNDLVARHNKLVGIVNRHIADLQPVGRPIAASEAQQAQILKHHKAGKSSRWIAEEMTLSRRTVTTVISNAEGTGRTTAKRRQRLGLEPKRKDWRVTARDHVGKRLTEHLENGRNLQQEAKGLR
jgi:hypothetical protein